MATLAATPAARNESDVSLVSAARAGDIEAFGELVKRYDRLMFRVVRPMAENRQDAKDIVQDAFVKAFCHIHLFEGRAAFSTWLVRIAVNEALGRIRRRQRFPIAPLEFLAADNETITELQVPSPAPTPEEVCGQGELRRALTRAIQRLTPRLRAVFVLRDLEGMSARETAEILCITVGTVKARLFRARQRLRHMLLPFIGSRPQTPFAAEPAPLLAQSDR